MSFLSPKEPLSGYRRRKIVCTATSFDAMLSYPLSDLILFHDANDDLALMLVRVLVEDLS